MNDYSWLFFKWLAKDLLIITIFSFLMAFLVRLVLGDYYNLELTHMLHNLGLSSSVVVLLIAYFKKIDNVKWRIILFIISFLYVFEYALIMSSKMMIVCFTVTMILTIFLCFLNYIVYKNNYYELVLVSGVLIILVSAFVFVFLYLEKSRKALILLVTFIMGWVVLLIGKFLKEEEVYLDYYSNFSLSSVTIRYAIIGEFIIIVSYVFRVVRDMLSNQ